MGFHPACVQRSNELTHNLQRAQGRVGRGFFLPAASRLASAPIKSFQGLGARQVGDVDETEGAPSCYISKKIEVRRCFVACYQLILE